MIDELGPGQGSQSIDSTQADNGLHFSDENARIAWQLSAQVREIARGLPPEEQSLRAETISFDPQDEAAGNYAILFSGTVVGTGHRGEFVVPQRSLTILERLGIPYLRIPE